MITRRFKSSPVKVNGLTPDLVPFESSLEEDYFVLLRFHRRKIASYSRPTESVTWFDREKRRRTYTPDALVRYHPTDEHPQGLTLLVEIKPDFEDKKTPRSRLPYRETDEERALKWAAATNFAVLKEWEFRVYRESEIRTPLLRNAKFLIQHLDRPAPEEACSRVMMVLSARGPTPIHLLMLELEPDLYQRAALYPALYSCIADGRIHADLRQMLKFDTVVSVAA